MSSHRDEVADWLALYAGKCSLVFLGKRTRVMNWTNEQGFCIISAREYPTILAKPSLQYTIGYSAICAFASMKLVSAESWLYQNQLSFRNIQLSIIPSSPIIHFNSTAQQNWGKCKRNKVRWRLSEPLSVDYPYSHLQIKNHLLDILIHNYSYNFDL